MTAVCIGYLAVVWSLDVQLRSAKRLSMNEGFPIATKDVGERLIDAPVMLGYIEALSKCLACLLGGR